jgi:glyoxylase-like metal-dependent hydrolase (beta-lactamase superfamily II)
MITRRFTLAGLGAIGLTGLTPLLARASVQLGDVKITSLSDGYLQLPGDFAFAHLPQDELLPLLEQYGVSRDQVEPPCNVTMLQDGERTVLFDVGSGPAFMPSAGALLDNLDAAGVAPEDVTHVVFTHAHPDHLWGLLDDFDDPVFPNASYMMGQTEWDYWTDPDTVNTIGEARASFAVGAARRLEMIEDTITMIQPGAEVLPGVMSVASFGHTPGHMSFEIRSGSESLMVVGDAIGNAHIAMARTDWPSGSDQDQEMGMATRSRLLDQLTQDKMLMLGFHLPGGGIGRVEKRGDGYHFAAGEM